MAVMKLLFIFLKSDFVGCEYLNINKYVSNGVFSVTNCLELSVDRKVGLAIRSLQVMG